MLRRPLSSPLIVPTDTVEHLLRLARVSSPIEIVGLLGGVDHHVHEIVELTNQLNHHPPAGADGFRVDPREQFRAERALAARGHAIVGIYHSHPRGGPTLSPADVAYARRWPVMHLVVAVDRPLGRLDEIRAYEVSDQITPVAIKQV